MFILSTLIPTFLISRARPSLYYQSHTWPEQTEDLAYTLHAGGTGWRVVSTTELSSKTDMSQFIKRHHSKPWLKDASQWLSNYEDLLQKRYEAKEVLPEHLNHDPHGIHLQMQRRLSRKKNKEVDIDRDIWEFTSSINDFLKVAPSRVRSKESQDLLQRLEAARTDLSNLRRKNTEEGPGQKALRGLDRGNKEYYTTLMAKKKAQDIWDKIKSI